MSQHSELEGSPGTEGPPPDASRGSTASEETRIELPEAQLPTIRVVQWGMVGWAVALVVVLLVPSVREGDRSWWVWVPLAGLALGAIGHVYLVRGRGNAADA
jgi:hypothetical protein